MHKKNNYGKKIITASVLLLSGMHVFNQYIDTCIPPVTNLENDKKYKWKELNIIYTEKGTLSAPPLLLLHNLYPSSSREEWKYIDDLIAQKYHIYELDLPGCGKSDKPNMTYINYLYVQIISGFIKDVIKTKCNICASAYSNSFAFMTARMYPDLIDKIIAINPPSVEELVRPVSKQSELMKKIIELPVIGTFLYNIKMSKSTIIDDYKYVYFYNDKNVPEQAVEQSYLNAHYNNGGKYLYSSMIGNYTNINILHGLSKIKNDIYLIANGKYNDIIQEYKKYNKKVHTIYVSNCRLLPHLEIPKTIADKINSIL